MTTQTEQAMLPSASQQQRESSGQQKQSSADIDLFRDVLVPDPPFVLSGLSPQDMFWLSPFSLMRRFQEDLDRFGFAREHRNGSIWSPPIEIAEKDGIYHVEAELPGLNAQDVKVEVTKDALVIEGERRFEHEDQNGGLRRTERRYGQFYRRISLPEAADVDKAKATFRSGVLEVGIPVPQQKDERRSIPIQTEAASTQTAPRSEGQRQAA
jgi:HSP20 family protein